ncbi:MAG: hypothetical protein QOG15_2173 [Solirubrobacteraceae bacterium]|jgi:hypothetical protein|nr:hypothetical protein [Solirubrobacteraceae bacterium]
MIPSELVNFRRALRQDAALGLVSRYLRPRRDVTSVREVEIP